MVASMKTTSNALAAALLLAVVLLGSYASGAHAALQVQNKLNQTLTVLKPPGCCSKCVPSEGTVCPTVCDDCADVVLEEKNQLVTLDSNVGPYPLPYLKFKVQDTVYCVPESGLKLIASTSILVVGAGVCGTDKNGIEAIIVDYTTTVLRSTCLEPCAAGLHTIN